MTFDSSLPNAGDSPSIAPGQIQTNFSRVKTILGADHQFNDSVDSSDGKHNKARFPEQASAPSTAVNEIAVYSKEAQSSAQLFARRESDGNEIQLTSSDVSNTGAQAINGYSCLPGGILIQWGTTGNISGSSQDTINFPKTFGALPYNVVTTQKSNSTNSQGNGNVDNLAAGTFRISNSSGSDSTFFWQAIGPA